MKIADELIKRFFSKQCTVEEAKQVAAYLKNYPDELEKYVSINEWNSGQVNEVLPDSLRDQVWENIERRNKTSALVILLRKSAVAAGIIGIIFLGYYQLADKKEYAYTKTAPGILIPEKIQTADITQKLTSNTSKKIMKIVLQDSSVVHLSPGAQIQYNAPFKNNKRDIYLTGEALFTVAKDRLKPFTVFAGSIATTALGTTFKIVAEKNNPGSISVKLFKGKVVLKSINAGLEGWHKDVYLLPGEQIHYNAEKMLVTVDKIKSSTAVKKHLVADAHKKSLPLADNKLNFNGAALPDVIEQLAKYFTVNIEFNKSEINAMNFTGTITKKDSLANVLKIIGQMNNLEILQNDNKLVIKKIKNN